MLNMRKIILIEAIATIIFLLVISLLAGILWLFIYKTGDQSRFPVKTSSNSKEIAILSRVHWDIARSYFFSIVKNQNPRVAPQRRY